MKRYLLLCLTVLLPFLALAQAGNPDSTFGTLGRKVISIGSGDNGLSLDKGTCLYKQDATRLLYAFGQVSAAQGSPMAVMRTDADGRPDTTFGVNGLARILFNSITDAVPKFITVIDGKIYVGGKSGPDMALARLTATGALDTSFNHTGKVTVDFGGTDEFPIGIVQYNSNPRTLYIAGNTDSTWALAKLKLNGALDLSFSADGKHTVSVGKGRMIGYEQGSGSQWGHMFGYSKTGDTGRFQFTMVRINLSNSAATTFKTRLTTGHNIVRAVAYNSNTAYLVGECRDVAGGNTRVGVLALTHNSVVVNGRFATAGRVLWGLPGQDVVPYAANVRLATSIPSLFVGGHARQGATESSFLLKLDKNGYGDMLFAGKGYQMIPFGQPTEHIHEIEFMGTRLGERIVAIGPGPAGSLLWSKTKNNTYLRVTPGWFPVQCPVRSNWNKIVDGGNHTTIILGDSGKFYNWYQGEDFVGSMPPIITWHRTSTGAGLTKLRGYKSSASPTDFWLVGDTGFAAKSGADGINNTWGRSRYPTRQHFNDVGSGGSGVGFIVGDSGLLIYDYAWNSIRTKLYTGTRQKLNDIDHNDYICGDSGIILKYVTASNWARQATPTTARLFAITSFPGGVVAVGENGTILRSTNGTVWTKINVPFTQDLYAVDGVSNAQIIVGKDGLILKSTDAGLTWRQQVSPTTENLRSVIVETASQASAVGDNGTVIMTMNGGTFVANQPSLGVAGLSWGLYPNPAARKISIEFAARRPGRARAEVVDLAGRPLQVLFDGDTEAGSFALPSDLSLPPGCYLVRLEVEGRVGVKKLVVE